MLWTCARVDIVLYVLFRPKYGDLRVLARFFPTTPLLALTATASGHQKQELLNVLRNPSTEIASVDKANISYDVFEFKPPSKTGMYFMTVLIEG